MTRVRRTRPAAPTAPAMLVRNVVAACESIGISQRALFEGLPLDPETLRFTLGRLPWSHMNALYGRVRELTTREQRYQIGAIHASTLPQLRAVAQLVLSPRLLLEMAAVGTRRLWPDVPLEVRDLPDERVEIRATYPAGQRLDRGADEVTTAFWATLPTLVGLPAAEVEEDFDDAGATWFVSLPESRTLAARTLSRFEPATETLMAELATLSGELSRALAPASSTASECEVIALQRRLGLTRAEARVAWRIAHGATPKEIAAELGVKLETVRTHLKRTYQKVGVRRQAELVQRVLGVVG